MSDAPSTQPKRVLQVRVTQVEGPPIEPSTDPASNIELQLMWEGLEHLVLPGARVPVRVPEPEDGSEQALFRQNAVWLFGTDDEDDEEDDATDPGGDEGVAEQRYETPRGQIVRSAWPGDMRCPSGTLEEIPPSRLNQQQPR